MENSLVTPRLKCEKSDCFCWHYGGCTGLRNAKFRHNDCPFYKTREQSWRETERAYRKLVEEGRFDLIEKYKDYYKAVGLYDPEDVDDINDPELYEMFQDMKAVEMTLRESMQDETPSTDSWE